MTSRGRQRFRLAADLRRVGLVVLALGVSACDGATAPPDDGPAVYEVEVAEQERFRIALQTEAQIARAEQALRSNAQLTVHGSLARGDGGFNAPYSWHLRPETVSFPDQTIEACSGRPMSDVEADVAYWVDTLGIYCPWSSRIVARVSR